MQLKHTVATAEINQLQEKVWAVLNMYEVKNFNFMKHEISSLCC